MKKRPVIHPSPVAASLSAILLVGSALMVTAESEPNNVLGDADPLPLAGSVSGTIDPAGDYDWSKVAIPGPGRLHLALVSPPANVRGEIVIYSRHATWMNVSASAINDGDDVYLDYDVSDPGTYFVRLRNLNGTPSAGLCTLTSSFEAVPDLHEPTGRIGQAALVTASPMQGYLFPGNEYDWYRVFVPAGNTLSLTLTEPALMRGQIALYGPDLQWLNVYQEAANAGDTVHLNYAVPSAGTYYIRLRDLNGGGRVDPYQLAVSGGSLGYLPPEPPVTTEGEPNDALHAANRINLGTGVTGAIGAAHEDDWFTFVPTQIGQVTFRLNQTAPNLQVRMRLYNDSGSHLLTGQAGLPGGVFTMTYEVTSLDRHYLLIDNLDAEFSATPYQFSTSVVAVNDPYEPNNDYGDAVLLDQVNQIEGYLFAAGDGDWYRLHVSNPGDLTVIASLLPPNLVPRIEILNMSRSGLATRVGSAGADLEVVYPIAEPGDYLVVVSASGGGSLSTDPYTLTLFGADFVNFAPVAAIDSIDPGAIVVGDRIDFTGSGTDSDGSVTGYEWTSNIDGVLSTASVFDTTSLTVGTHTISFRVRDNAGIWSTAKTELVYVGSTVSAEVEPNGTFHEANEVGLNRPLTAKVDPTGDRDYFKVYVPGPGRLVAETTNVPANLRLDLSFYGPYWDWLNISTVAASVGDDVSLGMDIATPGFYYLRVYDAASQAAPSFVYTLNFNYVAVPDAHEPNDQLLDATLLTTASATGFAFPGNNYDWFKVWVASGSTLVATLDPVPSDLRMQVALYGRNREWLNLYDTAVNPGDAVSAQYTVPADGYYYMRIKAESSARNWTDSYQLTVTGGQPGYTPPFVPVTVESEDNDVIADGNPVALGSSIQGTIADSGDPDWFAFDMPTPGVVHVSLSAVPASLRARVRLRSDDAELIDSRDATNAGDSLIYDVRLTTTGRYHITVEGISGSTSPDPYTLSLTATPVVDIYEPNNAFQEAVALAGLNRVQPYIFNTGDLDWFRVTSTSGSTLRVTCADIPADLKLQLEIYDFYGTRLATKRASNFGQEITLSVAIPADGEYHIRVNDVASGFSVDPYTVVIDGATFTSYVPVAVIDSVTPNPAGTGVPVTFTGHGEDVDGSVLAYQWRSSIDGVFSISQVAADITTLTPGRHTISYSVRDNDQYWSPEISTILFVGPAPAEIEPNGVAGSATPMNLDLPYTGMMDGGSDYDWFRIALPGPGRLTIQATNPLGSVMRTELTMYTPDLEWANVSTTASNDGDPVTLVWDLAEGGDYFLRLRDVSNRAGGAYTVTASLQEVPDPFEPNHDFDHAAAIAADDQLQAYHFPGNDYDWYSVTVTTPGSLAMSVTNAPSDQRLQISMYGRDREFLNRYMAANNDGDDVFLTYDIAEPGTYFIRLYETRNIANPNPYTFTTQFTPCPDAYEPNDTIGAAPELTGSPIEAYLFPGGNYDYYKIYAGAGASLEIIADNVPANLRLYLALYDRNGVSMNRYTQAAIEGDPVTLNYGPASGYYYLRVSDRDGDRAPGATYRLTINGADLGNGPVPPPATAEIEPNDDRGTATLIGTAPVTGSFSNDDWFKIEITEAAELTALVTPSANHRVGIRLYNNDGTLLATRLAENKGEINETVFPIRTAGTYFLRLRDEDGFASTNPYTLNVSLTAVADPHEPNDAFHQAAPIVLGAPVQGYIFPGGDLDYYHIQIPGAGEVRMEVTGVPANIEARLRVYNNNAALIHTKENLNGGEPLQASFQVAEAGSYRILIQDRVGSNYATTPYTLTAYFTPAVDPNEPNTLWRDATLLSASNQVSGKIHPAGDADWFRFEVTQPGPVRIQVTECNGINPYLALYNDSNVRLTYKQALNVGDQLQLNYDITAADTYYVVVTDYGNNQAGTTPYVLTIEGGQFDSYSPLAELNPVFSPNPALAGEMVRLAGMGSDEDSPVVGFEWTSDLDGLLANTAVLDTSTLREGTHRIGFRVSDSEGNWSGRIYQNMIVADPILGESEYNNSWTTALPVPLNTWLTGSAGASPDYDFYKIYLDQCGSLLIELDAVPTSCRGEITVYGENGEWLNLSLDAWNDGERVEYSRAMNPGWYHVRIRDIYNRALPGTYAVRFGFTPAGDRYEPNSSLATATPIPPNITINDATICPDGDYDFYRVDLPGSGRVRLRLENVPPAMKGQITLYDQNLDWLNHYTDAINGGEDVELVRDVDEAQTLYIRVRDIAGGSYTDPYTLDVSFTPVPDIYEPNDWGGVATLLPATTLSAYIFAPGDDDYYRIFMSTGQTLDMSITQVPALMQARISMYGPSLEWLNHYNIAENDGDNVFLSYTAPSDGMYFIRIYDNAGRGHLDPYLLTVTGGQLGVEPPFAPGTAESEPNGIWSEADDINLDSNVTGTIDPANDFDYYRIWLNAPGILTAYHTNIPAGITSEMWIHGPGFAEIAYRRTTNPGEDNILEVAAPTAGYHWIRVRDYGSNNASTEPYTLRVSHLPVVDPYEPNDVWGQATPLGQDSVSAYLFPGSDQDHYRVFVRQPGDLTLSLDTVPAANRPQLYIYDAGGTSRGSYVNTNPGVGGPDLLTYAVPEQGFYTIRVKDADGGYSADPYTLRISGADFSTAPDLHAIGDRVIDETILYQFTIDATDPDNPQDLVFSASGLPPGATFDPVNRAFRWTPLPGQAGVYPGIHFEVTDGTYDDSEDITITVNRLSNPPVLDPIGNREVTAGFEYTIQTSGSDPDAGDVLTFAAGSLPSGATFDPPTRTFRWTPTRYQSGKTHTVLFEVSDGTWTDYEYVALIVPQLTETYGEWRNRHFSAAQLADPLISGDQADPDGDGVPNIDEYSADTIPTDGGSYLRVTGIYPITGGMRLDWKGGVNADQFLEYRVDLGSGQWSTIHTNNAPTTVDGTFDHGAVGTKGFYRLRVERR